MPEGGLLILTGFQTLSGLAERLRYCSGMLVICTLNGRQSLKRYRLILKIKHPYRNPLVGFPAIKVKAY
jgi:hypothetical protein